MPVQRYGQQLHRARCAVGKPIRRVVQRPAARRVPGRRAVRQPARGAGADRGLADRVQHEAPAQQPGLARPGYLRRALGGSATRWTLISGGLAKGVRSVRLRRPFEGCISRLFCYRSERTDRSPASPRPAATSRLLFTLRGLIGNLPRGDDGSAITPEQIEAVAAREAQAARVAPTDAGGSADATA